MKLQHSEAQQSHEDELQSLRHTMQLVSEHMRTAQKEFDSNLKVSHRLCRTALVRRACMCSSEWARLSIRLAILMRPGGG